MRWKQGIRDANHQTRRPHKVEQYALLAQTTTVQEKVDATQLQKNQERYQARTLAVEAVAAYDTESRHEIFDRRPIEEPFSLSFDVRGSIIDFSPRQGIDIGIWAEGSGFKLTKRGGWYDSEVATSLRLFFRQNIFWQILTATSVFIALFFVDLFVLFQVPTNIEQDCILTAVFLVFFSEFVCLTASDKNYFGSFFFWMDFLGTASMICDISFLYGLDVSSPQEVSTSIKHRRHHHYIVARGARYARLGARASRLSRMLKMSKYLALFQKQSPPEDSATVAHVISNELNDVVATRIAFITIGISVVLPLFGMFNYPTFDDSLRVWTATLAMDAQVYFGKARQDARILRSSMGVIRNELDRFVEFYSGEMYGPFYVCFGTRLPRGIGCESEMGFDVTYDFQTPRRGSSIMVVSQGEAHCFFNLTTPLRFEALASMGLVVFIIFLMVFFSLFINHSVSFIALQPLERMLLLVREKCAQIFEFTGALQNEMPTEEDDEVRADRTQNTNEFVLLEKTISKLAAIADLNRKMDKLEIKEEMEDDDILRLNLNGIQVPSAEATRKLKTLRSSSMTFLPTSSGDCDDDDSFTDFVGVLENRIPHIFLDVMETWEFDSMRLVEDKALAIASAMYIIASHPGCKSWVLTTVDEEVFRSFIIVIESKYLQNPFHNFAHALDVCWSVARYSKLVDAWVFLGDVTQFWILIAAIGHDVGHLGLTNSFLVETSHALALTYNDRSPLENMHCSTIFEILGDDSSNVFKMVESIVYKEARKGIINAILLTDIVKHNELMKQLWLLYQMHAEVVDAQEDELIELLQVPANAELMAAAFLHCADNGQALKPWSISYTLAQLVVEEFFEQGDKQREAGIAVPLLNDREKANMFLSQIGFIELLYAPTVDVLVRIFPTLEALADHLSDNLTTWFNLWVGESDPSAQDKEKLTARIEKVRSRLTAALENQPTKFERRGTM